MCQRPCFNDLVVLLFNIIGNLNSECRDTYGLVVKEVLKNRQDLVRKAINMRLCGNCCHVCMIKVGLTEVTILFYFCFCLNIDKTKHLYCHLYSGITLVIATI